jgi:hypothetical protein
LSCHEIKKPPAARGLFSRKPPPGPPQKLLIGKKVPGEIYIIWKIMGGCHDAVGIDRDQRPMKENV